MEQSPAWPQEFPPLVEQFDLVGQTTGLLIVDMQNFAVHPDYGWGPVLRKEYPGIYTYFFSRLEREIIPNISKLLTFFRGNRWTILYCTVGPHLPDGSDLLGSRRRAARTGHVPAIGPVGTQEHRILQELYPQAGEVVLNKVSRGAFTSTGIDLILRNLGCDTLIVTGVHTNGCVESTARQAVDLGYKTVLVNDAMACFDQAMHDATLVTFRLLLGNVFSTEQVISQLSSTPQ